LQKGPCSYPISICSRQIFMKTPRIRKIIPD
jgi:hypothetical protein